MPNLLAPELAVWWDLPATLAAGSTAAVVVAALAVRLVRSAVWERAIWQSCIVALIALLLLELTGLGSAAVQLSVAGLQGRQTYSESVTTDLPSIALEDVRVEMPALPLDEAQPSSAQPLRTWWPAAWLIVSSLILGRMLWNRALLIGFQRGCERVHDAALRARVHTIAARLGLRHSVQVVTSPALRSPAVFHWLRPVLALPQTFDEEFSIAQQDAVLAHELAHLARRDPAWQSAAMFVCALLWWQPLVWWARRRLRAASEAAADEASLLLPDGPSQLAESLVSLAQRLTDPQLVAGISMQGNGLQSDLAHRVKRLLNLESGTRPAASPVRLVLAGWSLPVCFSLLGMFCTAWAPSRQSLAKGDTTMNVVANSWRSSVAATAFWAALSMGGGLQADDEKSADAKAEAVKEKKKFAPKDDAAEDRVQAIRQQIEALLKEGRKDEAVKLKQEAGDLLRKAKGGDEGSKEAKKVKGEEPVKKVKKGGDEIRKIKGGGEGAGVEQKLKAIQQEIEELIKQGRKDEAEKLKQHAEAMIRKVKSQGSEGGDAELKVKMIRQQAEQLMKEGRKEEAEKLMQHAEDMMRKLKGGGGSDDAEQHVKAIRQKAELLLKEGHKEEAEKLMRHAEDIASKVKGKTDPNAGGEREALEQKARAVREQVEQLRKEGKEDEARELSRKAEDAFRKFSGKGEPKVPGKGESKDSGDANKFQWKVNEKIKGKGPADDAADLRKELQQVQRELKEVREQLRQLQEKQK